MTIHKFAIKRAQNCSISITSVTYLAKFSVFFFLIIDSLFTVILLIGFEPAFSGTCPIFPESIFQGTDDDCFSENRIFVIDSAPKEPTVTACKQKCDDQYGCTVSYKLLSYESS